MTQDQERDLVLDVVARLSSEQFIRGVPGSADAIDAAEREIQLTFPADYRELMESSDG